MGRISSGVGLISGINSKDIIDQLMALEARPKNLLQTRIDQVNQQKLAYTDLSTRLTSLKLSATTLKKSTSFQQATATSSNENVLTATTSAGAALGTFQFQVARLVTSQQAVSGSFAGPTTKVGAGTITIEMGGGEVYSQTLLSQLNGGAGVQPGSFRITDRSGRSATIDISSAFTLDDVVRKINTSLEITVRAEIDGDRLKLTDLSGQTASNLIVTDLGGTTTATNLGLVGSSASNTLVGSAINYVGRSTRLADLNDGAGVRTATSADFRITVADGTTFDISLAGLTTMGQVIDAINTATGGKVVASVPANGKAIRLTDTTTGGTFSVAALNGSKAAADLGIEQTAPGNQIDGKPLIAAINTVLLSSLRGGSGLNLGTVTITNRAGSSNTVDFTGATTLRDVIDRINASGLSVTASLKESGNGIKLSDASGGIGNLVITDVSSTTAAELGIAGTFGVATADVRGANLQRRWVSENTLLSAYNGGRGVSQGKFKITDSAGASADIDLSTGTWRTLGDVINAINAAGIGVTASINANGDGLLLTDTAGGASKMKVEDVTGRAAADLNILGTATDTSINGSFEKTITLDGDDTLDDAITAINAPGFAVAAILVNDGTGSRLSLTARNSGANGRFLFDAGDTALHAMNLVEAQDAAVIYGGSGAAQPIVITSSTNQLTNVIKGVTIDLHSASAGPVTLTVAQNIDNVVAELNKFAESFNGLTERLTELMKFDSGTMRRGILLGDGTAQQIQQRLYSMLETTVAAAGTYTSLIQVGFRMGAGAKIELDEEKFRAAYSADPEAVKKLFTLYEKATATTPEKKGIGFIFEDRINALIDPVSGTITRQNQALDERTEQFQDRIAQLDKLLEIKRARLEKQFAGLESVLANLQTQQQSLTSLTTMLAAQRASKQS